jgi:hypothetical protein
MHYSVSREEEPFLVYQSTILNPLALTSLDYDIACVKRTAGHSEDQSLVGCRLKINNVIIMTLCLACMRDM